MESYVSSQVKRGDIIKVENLRHGEQQTHDQQGYRPWLVVSDEGLQDTSPFVIAIPFTSRKGSYQIEIDWDKLGLRTKTTGTLLCSQVKSMDVANRSWTRVEHVEVPKLVSQRLRDLMDL